MENGATTNNINENNAPLVFTANEVANVLGENYRSVAKALMVLANDGRIDVTEKLVNNRALKGYCLTITDLQEIKSGFIKPKHLHEDVNIQAKQMLTNAVVESNSNQFANEEKENTNIKFYEVVQENSDLKKEVEKLKQDIQSKNNENVRLDADLSMARSELKFIEDKSKSMESAYSEQKLINEKLNKSVNIRNYVIIGLSAVLLVIIVVVCCYFVFRG